MPHMSKGKEYKEMAGMTEHHMSPAEHKAMMAGMGIKAKSSKSKKRRKGSY